MNFQAKQLSVADYSVFGISLVVSAAIGFYYACTGGKQKSVDEFLMANRNMAWVPVSASMLASLLSAVTIIGAPGEIYSFGTLICWSVLSYIPIIWISAHAFVPLFHRLKVTSTYEYLGLRFGAKVRIVCALLLLTQTTMVMAAVLFAPALAFSAITGLSILVSVLSVGAVCTLYTVLGGMKAVVWTDTFQIVLMFIGVLTLVIKGSINEGGWAVVWQNSRASGRLDFDNWSRLFDPDPRQRHTIWSHMIGGTVGMISRFGVGQDIVQRALTIRKLKNVKLAYWANVPGVVSFALLCYSCGLVILSHYKECDPLTSKIVRSRDQLFPLFMMETLGEYPGLPGLILAAVFSGALSTLSSGLNALATISLQDFLRLIKPNLSDQNATVASKILSMCFGVLITLLALTGQWIGTGILIVTFSLSAIMSAPVLGVFILGMFFRRANSVGVFAGLSAAVVLTTWIGIGQILNPAHVHAYPVSVAGCNASLDHLNQSSLYLTPATSANQTAAAGYRSGVSMLYDISYQWISVIGTSTTVILGLLVSSIVGYGKHNPVPEHLINPFLHDLCCCLPKTWRRKLAFGMQVYGDQPEGVVTTSDIASICDHDPAKDKSHEAAMIMKPIS